MLNLLQDALTFLKSSIAQNLHLGQVSERNSIRLVKIKDSFELLHIQLVLDDLVEDLAQLISRVEGQLAPNEYFNSVFNGDLSALAVDPVVVLHH